MAVQVYDRWAKQLPDVGLMKVQDAETGSEMYIDTSSKKVRAAHARYWTEREAILRETFSQANNEKINNSHIVRVVTHDGCRTAGGC